MDKEESKELREYDFALALSDMRNLPLQESLYICQCLRDIFREKIIEGKSVYVFGIGRFQVKKRDFDIVEILSQGKT